MVAKLSLVECLAAVEDPRVDRTKAQDLQDILVLAVLSVLAVLCGADGSEDIELIRAHRTLGYHLAPRWGKRLLDLVRWNIDPTAPKGHYEIFFPAQASC